MSKGNDPLDVVFGLVRIWLWVPIILFMIKFIFWSTVFIGIYAWICSL